MTAGPGPAAAGDGPAGVPAGAGRGGGGAGAAGSPGTEQRGSLRVAFGGLTTRGRSFLAAGLAAVVCAYALGQSDLLRVGMLLTALPLVCVLVLHRTRHRVTGRRRLDPAQVPVRTEARVQLMLENVARLPTGLLMLEDRLPYVLGSRPRFVLDRMEAGGRREVSYRVRSDLRGCYPLGPLQLRLSDPFGMCELARSFSMHDTLTVVPTVETLPAVGLSAEVSGHGEGRQRSAALAGEDDVIPRGYRQGDDLRRVHWRSTARHGELMVRREEQPWRARCTVLLDTRRTAYDGFGPESPFEWAVSGAASVCLHLLERGYAVRLLTDTGAVVPGPDGGTAGSGGGADTAATLLEALAAVEPSPQDGLAAAYEVLGGGDPGGAGGGLLVAFLGQLDGEQAVTAARMRQRTSRAIAFVANRPGRAVSEASDPPLRALREAGWTALRGGPGAELPALWRRTDQATTRRGGR